MLRERLLVAENDNRKQPAAAGGPKLTSVEVIRRWLEIAEDTLDVVLMIDVQGNVLYGNPAAHRLLALDSSADFHVQDAHPTWANLLVLGVGIQTALLDGVWRGESALLNAAGEEVPVSEMILAHPDAQGRSELLSIVARDISEIKQTENALAASEQFYRRIVESANAGVWIVDPDNRVTFVNPRLARLLGYAVEEMTGQSVSEFMAGPIMASVKEERHCRLYRRDGAAVDAVLSISPLYNHNEEFAGTLGVIMGV